MNHIYDMLILGGGPAGYTAALYAARAGMNTVLIEKMSAGGQMALTGDIDNYPGFEEGIDGFTLGMKMQQGAERFGAKTEYAEIVSVDHTVRTSSPWNCRNHPSAPARLRLSAVRAGPRPPRERPAYAGPRAE